MRKIFAIGLIAFAISCAVTSCKNTLDSSTGQTDIVFPSSGVSYFGQVQPLFNLKCNSVGCHNSTDVAGGLDLSNYFTLIRYPGAVIAKDTVHSVLIQRVTGIGGIMPPSPIPTLNQNQIHGLKVWISEGAKYN